VVGPRWLTRSTRVLTHRLCWECMRGLGPPDVVTRVVCPCQLCLLLGLPLVFGPMRVVRAVMSPEKARATICFVIGLVLVFNGWSFVGMLLEIFAFFNLFGYGWIAGRGHGGDALSGS
jgi:hypothetical protein